MAAAQQRLATADEQSIPRHYAFLRGLQDVARDFEQSEATMDQQEREELSGYMAGVFHGICELFGVDSHKVMNSSIFAKAKHSPTPSFPTHKHRAPTVKRPKKRAKAR